MASRISILFVVSLALVGCSSAQKQRAAEREKLSVSSGMLCDFVNGDEYQDVEVQLNLEMARRCDPNKSFSMTDYKNASEVHGIVYCCALRKEEKGKAGKSHDHDDDLLDPAPAPKALPPAPKKEDKKEEKKDEKKAEPAKPADKKGAAAPFSPPTIAPNSPAPASVGGATPANPQPAAQSPAQPAKPAAQPGSTKSDMDAILDD